jgi:uridylate kinase
MEQKIPLIVFDLHKDGNILKAVSGEPIGTKVG